ncbi:MAG: hypothetical protein ABEJ42_06230 [Halobacteriaceae archaeon]
MHPAAATTALLVYAGGLLVAQFALVSQLSFSGGAIPTVGAGLVVWLFAYSRARRDVEDTWPATYGLGFAVVAVLVGFLTVVTAGLALLVAG